VPALKVLIFGNPFLRKKVSEVVFPDASLTKLAADMIDTMQMHEGVGLAAPQVGVDMRMIVADAGPLSQPAVSMPLALVNPVIISYSGQAEYREGCLSLPGIYADVKRPGTISVQFYDLDGNVHSSVFSGVEARIIQHEIDHLDGILFIDRLNPIRRWLLRRKLYALKKNSSSRFHQTRQA
jgi:peptide deformylase